MLANDPGRTRWEEDPETPTPVRPRHRGKEGMSADHASWSPFLPLVDSAVVFRPLLVFHERYSLNLISNCDDLPVSVLKKINQPLVSWNSAGLSALLRHLSVLQGYKSDVFVPCWQPNIDNLLTRVENLDYPFRKIRWIFISENGVSRESMSKAFQRVACRAVVVTPTAAYVPNDTYSNCWDKVRRLGPYPDPAFEDRPIGNLTKLRIINEIGTSHEKDWQYRNLEPQATIVKSIVQKSGVTLGGNLTLHYSRFGRSNENHLFRGALGAIQNKDADLGAFQIYVTESIWYGVDVAGIVGYDAVTFFSPLPNDIKDLAIIGRPFSRALWAAVWASLGVYMALISAFSLLHRKTVVTKTRSECRGLPLTNLLFYLTSVLIMHVPSLRFPAHCSIRILLGFWFMFAITMSAIFTGALTSYTNFPPKTRPIKTLQRLGEALGQSKVRLCIKNNRYFRSVLQNHVLETGDKTLKDYLKHLPLSDKCMNTLCCLRKVTAGTHVFVASKEDARHTTGKTFAGTVPADEELFQVLVTLVAPKASPYTRAFSRITNRLRETAVSIESQRRAKYKHIQQRTSWLLSHNKESCACRALQLKDLLGLLVVLGMGLVLAALVLLCEVALARITPLGNFGRSSKREGITRNQCARRSFSLYFDYLGPPKRVAVPIAFQGDP
ncbi:hypothetical protein HPB47_024086 [Ixodes persulcatus]|uniref:Uncharacterized protein n=1 Tax=Ixodes persulcatus TaxID=34615 RepID=A0AC60Q596_IXOPE|nr:hypothetical protein HPB47_024086 [Ixodes persulcatus]